MNRLVKATLEIETRRKALGILLDLEDRGEDYQGKLEEAKAAITAAQTDLQNAAEAEPETPEHRQDNPAGTELRELRSKVEFGKYVAAAMTGNGVSDGAEREYNQHLGIADNYFPLALLAGKHEERAARDGDAQASQGTWLDRVFNETAAERVGISFRPVPPGVSAYPVTTAGGSPAQRGRTQAAAESTYTVDVTEMKPARRAVHGIYSIEDDMRLPGLSDAIERDMRLAMLESVDRAVFNGDAGANENVADITGMRTAGIVEVTLTQANKVKADETLKLFLALVDGNHAGTLGDLNVVTSVGANTLWYGRIHNSAADNQTIAQFMMASGLAWMARGSIDANTANGDFGAYVGLGRGIEGAGIAAVWEQGQLIRDPFTGGDSGNVQLTLNFLWQLSFPRTDNFKRLKFVS